MMFGREGVPARLRGNRRARGAPWGRTHPLCGTVGGGHDRYSGEGLAST